MLSSDYVPPLGLTVISLISLGIAALASLWLTFDIIHRRGWRTMMGIMIPVYIINALYLWPITVWTYLEYGRPEVPESLHKNKGKSNTDEQEPLLHPDHETQSRSEDSINATNGTTTASRAGKSINKVSNDHRHHSAEHEESTHQAGNHHHMNADRPLFATITIATCHCGAGCVLGDIIGEWLVYSLGVRIGGSMLYASFVVDFILALVFGIIFQYFSIAPMAGDYGWKTINRAIKADVLSLTFFEIGLFGWMAIFDLLIFRQKLHMNTIAYWFMMQIGMFFGHWTGFPINWWLIKQGIKEACA